jgi:hypothetical protein
MVWWSVLTGKVGAHKFQRVNRSLGGLTKVACSWTYEYKLCAIIDTFYVLKDEAAGQCKYNVPVYQLWHWREHIEELDIDCAGFAVGPDLVGHQVQYAPEED